MNRKQPFKRAERVSDLIRKEVSEILMNSMQHRGFEQVTVTAVHLTDDLQHAKILFRVWDLEKKDETQKKLIQAVRPIRRELGNRIRMRYTPEIRFEYDESLDYVNRIDQLLTKADMNAPDEEPQNEPDS